MADTKPEVIRESREYMRRERQRQAFWKYAETFDVDFSVPFEQAVHRMMVARQELLEEARRYYERE